MSEQPNNSSDSLERLLGRWGADRAVRGTPLPAMPAGRGRRPMVVALARWAPLAAAAALFVVSGVMFFGGPWQHQARDAITVAPASPGHDDGGYHELEVTEDVADRRGRLADEGRDRDRAYYELREERDALAEENEVLRRTVADQSVAGVPRPEARLPAETDEDEFDGVELGYTGQSSGEVDDDAGGLQSLGYADGFSAGEQRRGLVVAGLPSSDGPTLVRVYLSMVAPDESGLAAIQVAVRKRQLMERCHRLQQRLADTEHQGLLDRVEVVLTQTEMVNASEPRQAAELVLLSRAGALREALAGALAESDDTELREFLLEVQILMEAVDSVA